jgi:hypothetical protein
MLPTVADAARNNAEWCDIVCRSHGIPTMLTGDTWNTTRRSPPLYPDAVTFDPAVTAGHLLQRVDAGPGCSIKDSFATLELEPHGFHVLFDAEWIGRDAGAAPGAGALEPLTTADELTAWEAAWGGDAAPTGRFRPALLGEPSVVILAARVDRAISAGAVLNFGAGVVGVSNVFANDGDLDAMFAATIAAAAQWFPNAPIVGYESGAALAAARRSGFEVLGPLHVWINDADARRADQ